MSVNKVILLGHVGKDPEVRHLEGGNSVANFALATTDRGYTKKDGTTVPDQTEWHNIVVWGGLVKVVEPYVKKGTQLYLEGKIKSRSYDDKEGNKRYITEVYANSIQLLGGKQSEQQSQTTEHNQILPDDTPPNDESDDLPF